MLQGVCACSWCQGTPRGKVVQGRGRPSVSPGNNSSPKPEVTMSWLVLAARLLVGLPFLVFGLDYFLKVLAMPTPEFTEHAGHYATALGMTGYMDVVKVREVVGGALVLPGRMTPLGLVLVTPVTVNIALFDIFLMHQPALGVVLTVLCFFLVWAYRSHFAGVFTTNAKIG